MLADKLLKPPQTTPTYIEDVFSTYLYTGNGTSQSISNGIDLSTKGGMVWLKGRTGTQFNNLEDTNRGAGYSVYSNSTIAQEYFSGYGITSFNTNGFTLGLDNYSNANTVPFASWTFRKQPKFFDVVTYTGNGTTQNIAHSLGSTPGCIIVKQTSGINPWTAYHAGLAANQTIVLNTTAAATTTNSNFIFGNNSAPVAPTSSVFTVGQNTEVNTNGETYVAYLFANNAGGFGLTGTDNVISCGFYTGNGATPGPTINLGWEPQFLLVKNASAVADWYMYDNMRGLPVGSSAKVLSANTSAAEVTAGAAFYNLQPTGFQIQGGASTAANASGNIYIYIAIRRGPMKVPTDATKVFKPVARAGTGATASITGLSFPPSMIMTKDRAASTYSFVTQDKLRGAAWSDTASTAAENVGGTASLVSYNMDGVTFSTSGAVNGSGLNYDNLIFQRAPNFFDEVCYTGTGANLTVNHNLGVVPEIMIIKSRSAAQNWCVYSAAIGNTGIVQLNTTAATITNSLFWNNTSPTSTTFTLGASTPMNTNGQTAVAYLFATCAGVSKVGSYTGNGATQAIACGFAGGARFVLIKRTDSTGDWYVYDTARGMTTLTDPYLLLNSTSAESATLGSVTTTTGGFTVNASILAAINTNGASYIFLAIA